MSEFVNRMALQREVLRAVNARPWKEELLGLSKAAIMRWTTMNRIPADSVEVDLVTRASRALNFLATKSQDQVSLEYEQLSHEARKAARQLEHHFRGVGATE